MTQLCLGLRDTVAKMLPYVKERDDRWISWTKDVYGLPEQILRDSISHGDDSAFLVILIYAARHVIRTEPWKWELLPSISKFNILNTQPGLRNEFCALWNDIIRRARAAPYPHIRILSGIRHLYIALHQGTDAAPTTFDASTSSDDPDLENLRVYPLCNIPAHHADSTGLPPTQLDESHRDIPHPSHPESQLYLGDSAAAQHADEANIVQGPPSSAGHAHARSRGSPFTPPTALPEPLSPRPKVIADPSIHERTEMTALDLSPLTSRKVSHHSRQPSLSTTDVVYAEQPTRVIMVTGRRASQAGTETLHTLSHPDPVPVTVTPSTVSHPPSISVRRPGDVVHTF